MTSRIQCTRHWQSITCTIYSHSLVEGTDVWLKTPLDHNLHRSLPQTPWRSHDRHMTSQVLVLYIPAMVCSSLQAEEDGVLVGQ